jgi:hypothetical protein
MDKSDYRLQKMVHKFLYEDKGLEKEIEKGLEKVKKERDKKPQPKVTRLVDRKGEDRYDESYHDQMQELARQEEENYLPDDVEHL